MASESKASDEFYQTDIPAASPQAQDTLVPGADSGADYPKEVDKLRMACLHGTEDGFRDKIGECRHCGSLSLALRSNKDSMTCLKLAVRVGSHYCVRQLLSAGADPNDLGGPVDVTSPLHTAVAINRIDMVKTLLEAGAKQNPAPGTLVTPAMLACQNGAKLVLEELLTHGADLTLLDSDGESAFHIAAKRGHVHLTRLLLSHRGDPHGKNGGGFSAMDLAKELSGEKRDEFERTVAAFDSARKLEGAGGADPAAAAAAAAAAGGSEGGSGGSAAAAAAKSSGGGGGGY